MVGTMIVMAYYGLATAGAMTALQVATAFAINFVVSSLVSRAFAPGASQKTDNGVRQQIPPSSTNSIPVVYGTAYTGGQFVDAVMTTDNQALYYVMVVSHISPNGQFTFDRTDMYWGDRKMTFDGTDQTRVVSLTDGSGNVDTKIDGNLFMYFYTSTEAGVITSANGAGLPSSVMGGVDIDASLRWPASGRQMNGLAFVIIKLIYSREDDATGIQNITYKVKHALNGQTVALPGDVWYDYLTNQVYGCAMDTSLVDSASATALNAYSNETISYQFNGTTYTQPRYRINGVIDTGQSCLNNINQIMTACDSWNQYDEVNGKWSVIANRPETVAYAFTDDVIIGEIRVSAFDITSSINQIEAEFPDGTNRDKSNYVYSETPSGLLYANEPTNKTSLSFSLVNDSVQAQYLANRLLEQAREDLIVSFKSAYPGIQVEAGDVVSVTNSNYGWDAKPFRVMRVTEFCMPDGTLGASFELNEYNSQVYDDQDITKYTAAGNSNLPDPSYFGPVPAPVVIAQYPSIPTPTITIQPYMGAANFVLYAEVWYSAFSSPTASQLYFGGVTATPSNGTPYTTGQTLPTVTFSPPPGSWYFFTKLVNGLASSQFSAPSTVLNWSPTTIQFQNRYLSVAYATSSSGAGFSLTSSGKTYYGLSNTPSANPVTDPSLYTWFPAGLTFGSSDFVLFCNRTSRRFSFDVGGAAYAGVSATFVPTDTAKFDTSIWSALETGTNIIDLDQRTGQLTKIGTTSVSSADGLLSVTNNTNGSMVVSLEKFLNFGAGVYSKTVNVSTLTIDVYGRVVGYTQPDGFYFTESVFSATAGQTSFSVTHTVGNVLVFRDGVLLSTDDYTETASTVVMNNACAAGEIVVVLNFRAVSTDAYYENLRSEVVTVGTSSVVVNQMPYQLVNAGDKITFTNSGTPTQYTVSTVNSSTKTITFTTAISGVTAGNSLYRYRATGAAYAPFSRAEIDVTAATTITPTAFSVANGFEMLFANGIAFSEIDYDVSGTEITGFPSALTGKFIFIQFAENNYGVPCSNITNTVAYSVNGALSYSFANNPLAFSLYANGALLAKGSSYDYTANSAGYTLTSAINNNYTLLNNQTYARDGAA